MTTSRPADEKPGKPIPPEIEDELAALMRPSSAEELFTAAGASPEQKRRLEARIRDLLARHGLSPDDAVPTPPEDAPPPRRRQT